MCQKILLSLMVVGVGLMGCADGTTAHSGDGLDTSLDTATELSVDTDSGVLRLECDTVACQPIDENIGYGKTAEQMACAMGLCGETVIAAGVTSLNPLTGEDVPGADCKLENMARAVSQFGAEDNDLAPEVNGAHVFIANAPITLGFWASGGGEDKCEKDLEQLVDPWANHEVEDRGYIKDAVELRLILKAPENALGFKIRYIFMSSEWDNWLKFNHTKLLEGGKVTYANDKFYILKKSSTVNRDKMTSFMEYDYNGRELVNFTGCRFPDLYWHRICGEGDIGCGSGERVCSVGAFSGIGECCWFECDDSNIWSTDLTGTGFECAADEGAETGTTGSSSGWLETSWPVESGEEFEIIFHINDAWDGVGGSAALVDSFQFVREVDGGTIPI